METFDSKMVQFMTNVESQNQQSSGQIYQITSDGNVILPASMTARELQSHLNSHPNANLIEIFEGVNSTQRTSKMDKLESMGPQSPFTENETTNKKQNILSYGNLQETFKNNSPSTNLV